jgi:hypothetical protein
MRADEARVADILNAIRQIQTYTAGLDAQTFTAHRMACDADALKSSRPNRRRRPAHDNNNSKSSRFRVARVRLSAVMTASARSRLVCCNSNTFCSTVSRVISR